MMIVEDKEKTIQKADEIAIEALKFISKQMEEYSCIDDPAEQVYLAVHTIGNLTARMCETLDGYSKTYGIERMDKKTVLKWINAIIKAYMVKR
jgi:hypothetical protein